MSPRVVAQAILIATGSEVHVAVAAAKLLAGEGIGRTVVSMPSWELFVGARRRVSLTAVLPRGGSARASPSRRRARWAGSAGPASDGAILAMAPVGRLGRRGDTLFTEFGFTPTGAATRSCATSSPEFQMSDRPCNPVVALGRVGQSRGTTSSP
jgi:transketolase